IKGAFLMAAAWFSRFLRGLISPSKKIATREGRRTPRCRPFGFRPMVEMLEDRTLPSTIYAIGNGGTQLITIDSVMGTATLGPQLNFQNLPNANARCDAFTPNGTLYTIVSDSSGQQLATINLINGLVTPVGSPNLISAPFYGLASDPNGN